MAAALTLRARAKINLTLRVGLPRPDGFHDVRTVMQSIALADAITCRVRRGPFALTGRAPGLPADRDNLVWRAAARLWRALGRAGDPCDAHVRLDKVVPIGAGLGGGSADAAAALVALHRIWGGTLHRAALVDLAADLGSDVPFFLVGGTALAAGRGEELYPLADVRRLGIVIVTPSFPVATADAYRWLDEDRASGLATDAGPGPAALDVGWPAPLEMRNDLQAPVGRRHPDIPALVASCLGAGARAAAMTGSGSAVFGVFSEAGARAAARRLRGPGRLVLLTRTATRREAALPMGL
jgi:4-diphosphocytidyl-2-C-methyl-D-erythritol kinase